MIRYSITVKIFGKCLTTSVNGYYDMEKILEFWKDKYGIENFEIKPFFIEEKKETKK